MRANERYSLDEETCWRDADAEQPQDRLMQPQYRVFKGVK